MSNIYITKNSYITENQIRMFLKYHPELEFISGPYYSKGIKEHFCRFINIDTNKYTYSYLKRMMATLYLKRRLEFKERVSIVDKKLSNPYIEKNLYIYKCKDKLANTEPVKSLIIKSDKKELEVVDMNSPSVILPRRECFFSLEELQQYLSYHPAYNNNVAMGPYEDKKKDSALFYIFIPNDSQRNAAIRVPVSRIMMTLYMKRALEPHEKVYRKNKLASPCDINNLELKVTELTHWDIERQQRKPLKCVVCGEDIPKAFLVFTNKTLPVCSHECSNMQRILK